MICGVFFQAFAPTALLPNALSVDLAAKEIAAPLGHGMSVQAQKLRELSIATAPELLRFKPRIEPSLPFVQKTEEQNYGRLQLMRECRNLWCDDLGRRGRVLPAEFLASLLAFVIRQVDLHSSDLDARHLPFPIELQQGTLALNLENALQLAGGDTALRLLDKLPCGFHEVAIPREPHRMPVPEALFIVVRNLVQRVVLPPVRVAREIPQLLQLPEHRHGSGRAKRALQLFERGNLFFPEKGAKLVGGELGSGHVV